MQAVVEAWPKLPEAIKAGILAVIGLATRKKGDELIAHFNAMLKGRSLPNLGPAPDPFEQEIRQIQGDLKLNEKIGWWMSFHPDQHIGNRWTTPEELEHLITTHSVRIYDEFPGHKKGTFQMGWGIANDLYGETWALTKSGIFCFSMEFRENQETANHTGYRGGGEARHPIPPGEWIECTWAISTVVDFFLFQAEAYGPGQDIHIAMKVGPLVGRKLVSLGHNITLGYGAPEACRAPFFSFDQTIDAETLRTNWESTCAEILKQFFGLFPNNLLSLDTILKFIEKYKTRRL